MNGFKRNKDFLSYLCEKNNNMIIGVQEHWLSPSSKKFPGTDLLRTVHHNYEGFGSSAMKRSMDEGMRKGRPFGGTGFVYRKSFAKCLSPLPRLAHERISTIELQTDQGKILVLNVYFPYFDHNNVGDKLDQYRSVIGALENIMLLYSNHKVILMADFNCNIFNRTHPFSRIIIEFMQKHDLISCFDCVENFDATTYYTRSDTRSRTLIDGFVFSSSLKDNVKSVDILQCGNNISDHLPVIMEMSLKTDTMNRCNVDKPTVNSTISWSKMREDEILKYKNVMDSMLDDVSVPFSTMEHDYNICTSIDHIALIEEYYSKIVDCITVSESYLPKTRPSHQKSYWNNYLTQLKTDSIDAHKAWNDAGSPRHGILFDNKKATNNKYKKEIRTCQVRFRKNQSDDLFHDLTNKNQNAFWKTWNKMNSVNVPPVPCINGKVVEQDIADCFADEFEKIYDASDPIVNDKLKREFYEMFPAYFQSHQHDDIRGYLLSWSDMKGLASDLKTGKSSSGKIRNEHILYGSPKLLVHLHILFNYLIQHSYVVKDFLKGEISPTVKDRTGDINSTSNYRGITLSNPFGQLFEKALRLKFGYFLPSNALQFGFKQGMSTCHAMYALKNTINHYTTKGSKVFVAFMDLSKAFDLISHYGLFIKLMKKNVPLCFIRLIVYWYLNMSVSCKWGSSTSRTFNVSSGTKQGGVLSPDLFAFYIDDVFDELIKAGVGCHIAALFIACILFADDMALLAPTRSALQKLINICAKFFRSNCLTFNAAKTKVMIFGRGSDQQGIANLMTEGHNIDYVTSWKYLGFHLTSGNDCSFDHKEELALFYRKSNAIVRALSKPNETVLLHLLYSNCVSVFTYGSEVKEYSSADFLECNTAVNSAIRTIFSFRIWQSIRFIRDESGYRSLTELFAKARKRFSDALSKTTNPVLLHLYRSLNC